MHESCFFIVSLGYFAYFRGEVPTDYHLAHCQRLPDFPELAATQMSDLLQSGCVQMLPSPPRKRMPPCTTRHRPWSWPTDNHVVRQRQIQSHQSSISSVMVPFDPATATSAGFRSWNGAKAAGWVAVGWEYKRPTMTLSRLITMATVDLLSTDAPLVCHCKSIEDIRYLILDVVRIWILLIYWFPYILNQKECLMMQYRRCSI